MKTLLKCLLAVITITILMYVVGCFVYDDTDTSKWSEDGRIFISIAWLILSMVFCAAICDNSKKY